MACTQTKNRSKTLKNTEAWEQCKISHLFNVTRGEVIPVSKLSIKQTPTMQYPVYSSQTKDNGLLGYYEQYLFENSITWTTDGANAGTVRFRKGKFFCTNVCGVLNTKDIEPDNMVAEVINRVAKRYVSYVGNPKLMNNVMSEIVICIPNDSNERNKISSILKIYDNFVALHQRQQKRTPLKVPVP
ncbi:restriction endonuclease subunit S [Ignavigranum ruoffiae]